ncbi:MAG: hypothetical protein DMG68_11750 [Acidobacteria bacterium]|nr:MAG: hypothetical protein DMG68_11750 [Acidobacteriota bacterium]
MKSTSCVTQSTVDGIRHHITSLRRELDAISAENREYYKSRDHSDILKRRYEDRRIRVIQIRAELLEMLNDDLA